MAVDPKVTGERLPEFHGRLEENLEKCNTILVGLLKQINKPEEMVINVLSQ